MKRKVSLLVLGVLFATALAGSALAGDPTVRVATKEGLGKFLTDGKGMTLYLLTKDPPGKSTCDGPCEGVWPVFYAEKVAPAEGLKASDFSVIPREDGKKQTGYKGIPLYYYVKDAKPGDVTGQGRRDVWFPP
jgi:predicted lipoprotein with Yx(FWY)xxD motif